MLSRRELLTAAGGGLVTLLLTPLVGACGSSTEPGTATATGATTPAAGCDGAGETSTVVAGHTHTLCVPASDLSQPPAAGATYSTSISGGHDHAVALTSAQLTTVLNGGSVSVTTSTVSGHAHEFSVRKAAVPAPVPTTPRPGYPGY
ncbi:MAG TPA: hypothetical protein VLT33_29170 [Labilithrix sp.]|nr:hypothetical protein [Labilithrix sp.]